MTNPMFPLAFCAYTAGIVLSILGTMKRSRHARIAATATYVVAFVLHLAALALFSVQSGHFPFSNAYEFLVSLGWMVLGLYLWAQLRWRVDAAGLVLPPVAFLMTVFGVLKLPAPESGGPLLQHVDVLLFHTMLATLGMAAFFVAAAMSLIYVLQDRALKSKSTLALLDRLPSLDKADRAGLEAMLWGFPLFTLGIVSGIALSVEVRHQLWIGGAKGVFPVLSWLIFAGVLVGRLTRGFRGRKAAYLTMAGFVLGLLTIAGIAG